MSHEISKINPYAAIRNKYPLVNYIKIFPIFFRIGVIWGFIKMCIVGKQACLIGCAQTLPDATSLNGKIHLFRKVAVTFETIMQF